MEELKDRVVTINGIEELVLRKPKSRDDLVRITQGGMSEFATEITIEDFESYTNKYFKGLEPHMTGDLDHHIERLNKEMTDLGFEVDLNTQYGIVSGVVKFSTNSSVFDVDFIVKESDEKGYLFAVRKSGGYGLISSLSSDSKHIQNVVDNIVKQAKKYTSAMVQNLTLGKSQMKNNTDRVREISDDGIPKLLPDETLSDYFKTQDMPAGAVINGKGRYQTFSSYVAVGNKLTLHYITKDYASKKNAEKALNKFGYDIDGKQLDSMDTAYVKEQLCTELSRKIGSSWSDDYIAECSMGDVFFQVSNIQSKEDPKFGVEYFVNINMVDIISGKEKSETINIDARSGGNVYSIQANINDKINDLIRSYKAVEVEFDEDLRTDAEKIAYHHEQIAGHKKQLVHYKARSEEMTAPRDKERFIQYAEEQEQSIDKHLEEISKFEIDEPSFSM
ncbi:hypothetical protein [Psychromonas sp. SP041]|uniref:hypothetical protein n=1 Tax=Psychromonas sp. SP041 TaxID=1365007 RepID=UPI0010C793F2|nr:hypothetical protein [Psychromonas sp. SP041]